jgi:hypothetical protein
MSSWDWGPPPDSDDSKVVVIGPRHPIFTGCRVAVVHRAVIDNEEDGTEIAVCDPVVWSRAWPELRRFYDKLDWSTGVGTAGWCLRPMWASECIRSTMCG